MVSKKPYGGTRDIKLLSQNTCSEKSAKNIDVIWHTDCDTPCESKRDMAHTMWIQNVSIEHNYEQYLQWERGIFFGLKDAHILQMQGMILFTL